MSACLLIFIKNPELGKVKTRLAATIGDKKALQVYETLLEKTRSISQKLNVTELRLYYSDVINFDDAWGESFVKFAQEGADLGQRMKKAFQKAFKDGFEKVVIIGSDCWQLETEHLKKAFNVLEEKDTVIGPANDGGYYLLGMSKQLFSLFENKSWSQEHLIKETIDDLNNSKSSYTMLEELIDVDTEEDMINSKMPLL